MVSGCCRYETKNTYKMKGNSVLILKLEEGWRGMESRCFGCETKTTYKKVRTDCWKT